MVDQSRLIECFSAYFSSPSDVGVRDELLSVVVGHGVPFFGELEGCVPGGVPCARLYSNGSFGGGSVFELPFSHFWLFGVERFLKSGGVGFSIGLHLVAGSEISFTRSDFNSWCGGWLRVGYGVDPFLLRRRLLGLFGLFGGLNLVGRNFVFLFLFGDVGFRDVLSGLFLDKVLFSVVNTDDVPFFDSGFVLVNDQMMDWGSGVGFWGCRFGVRHFLPLFNLGGLGVPLGVGGNLLGFGGGGLVDDFLVCDGGVFRCGCGLWGVDSTFISHFCGQLFDVCGGLVDVSKLVVGLFGFRLLQFLQVFDVLTVFYVVGFGGVGELGVGLDRLFEFFRGKYRVVNFVRGSCFFVGRKRPVCWSGGGVRVSSFMEGS